MYRINESNQSNERIEGMKSKQWNRISGMESDDGWMDGSDDGWMDGWNGIR